MSTPPKVVAAARNIWRWQWNQLMDGLATADQKGNYLRPLSEHQEAIVPKLDELSIRTQEQLPRLIIGRSCPWAHRVWLVHQIRKLNTTLKLLTAKADHNEGRWKIDPKWLGCNSLTSLYRLCNVPPKHRATVPALILPGTNINKTPKLLGNESAQLVEVLNQWPTSKDSINLAPAALREEIESWQRILQPTVNDGVYRCGFARNQTAYDKACGELFEALNKVDQSLQTKGPWLCGEQLTLADIRLFPTLIRWEMIYSPLFGCSQEPLWSLSNLWDWRKKLHEIPAVAATCDALAWRKDYFGALFPLRPSNIIPSGPDLGRMVNASPPDLK